MDFNITNNLSILKKILIILFLTSCAANAYPTIEAVSADGAKLYSGDSISITPTINITIESSLDLTSESDAIVIRINNTDSNLTPSTRSAGTITASHQPTLSDSATTFRIWVKDTNGETTTWEATNLLVDSGAALSILGNPLNFPNPCNADTGTAIGYKLTKPANITVSIHDLMGNLIWKRSYASGTNGGRATYNEIVWDVKTESGSVVGNGIYVYLIIGDGKLISKGKIAIIK